MAPQSPTSSPPSASSSSQRPRHHELSRTLRTETSSLLAALASGSTARPPTKWGFNTRRPAPSNRVEKRVSRPPVREAHELASAPTETVSGKGKEPVPKFGQVFNRDVGGGTSRTGGVLSGVVSLADPVGPHESAPGVEGAGGPASPASSESTMSPETLPIPQYSANTKIVTYSHVADEPDTEIRVLDTVYHLHSFLLRASSKWFASSMSRHWTSLAGGGAAASPGNRRQPFKYTYTMEFDFDANSAFLVPTHKHNPDRANPSTPKFLEVHGIDLLNHPIPGRPAAKHAETPLHLHLANAFKNMLDCYYRVSKSQSYDLYEAEYLTHTAEQYQSLSCVSPAVQASITSQKKWYVTVRYSPLRHLLLALKLQSPIIFREAFVHVVGRWYLRPTDIEVGAECNQFMRFSELKSCRHWHDAYRLHIPRPALTVIMDEVLRLEHLASQALKRLMAFRFGAVKPPTVKSTVRAHVNKIVEENAAPGQEGALFRAIEKHSFQPTKEELDIHVKLWKDKGTPMNLEKAMAPSVKVVKGMVKPLAENVSMLNGSMCEELPGYLLCASVDETSLWTEGGLFGR